MKKKIAVLGATGSIGANTLDVLRAARDDFEPVLFTAYQNSAALFRLASEYPKAAFVLIKDDTGASLPAHHVFYGADGLRQAVYECKADIAVNGIAGAAGLMPSLAALDAGAELALANKESVVMAWDILANKAKERGTHIIPVDSEHSAIYHLIRAHCRTEGDLAEIILTASGGPFRTWPRQELAAAAAAQALCHPTWNMGAKITIDSATLANKGLEVIEAARLFSLPPSKIRVVIHPQSIVHSMIRTASGALYAELSQPDMRLPIHHALYHDAHKASPFGRLDFDAPDSPPLTLQFSAPDGERFPMLGLAFRALAAGGRGTIAYNAANEEAVALYAASKIGFYDIPAITEAVLETDWEGAADSLEDVFETDRRARQFARKAFAGINDTAGTRTTNFSK